MLLLAEQAAMEGTGGTGQLDMASLGGEALSCVCVCVCVCVCACMFVCVRCPDMLPAARPLMLFPCMHSGMCVPCMVCSAFKPSALSLAIQSSGINGHRQP